MIPVTAGIYPNPIFTKDKSRLHQFGTKMLPGRAEFWRRLDWRLNHRGLGTTLRATSRQKFISKKLQETCGFLCADGSAQRQTSRHQIVERFDAEEFPKLRARRGVTLGRAQGITLCKKTAELQTFLKLIAMQSKQGMSPGVCLENLFIATMSYQEKNCMTRKNRHSQFRQHINVVRQTNTDLDNSEENVSMIQGS